MKYFGLDYSVDDKKKVLSIGTASNTRKLSASFVKLNNLTGRQVKERISNEEIFTEVSKYENFILSIDAPFGWPRSMANGINHHIAGNRVEDEDRGDFFRRYTDLIVQKDLEQSGLLVGADKLGITAYECLKLIDLFDKKNVLIDTVGQPHSTKNGIIIETYPGAFLRNYVSYDKINGYKSNEEMKAYLYEEILSKYLIISEPDRHKALKCDDHFDSLLCLIASRLYHKNELSPPCVDKLKLTKKEGWIWAIKKIKCR